MKTLTISFLLLGVLAHAQAPPSTCAASTSTVFFGTGNDGMTAPQLAGNLEHSNGSHSIVLGEVPPGAVTAPTNAVGKCIYTHGAKSQSYCNTQCSVFLNSSDTLNPLAGITRFESGDLATFLPAQHVVTMDFAVGLGNGVNSGTSCTGAAAGAAASCGILNLNCAMNISVAVNGNQPNISVTKNTGSDVWEKSLALPLGCGPVLDPQ